VELKKEQLVAINHDEGNLLVSASAGSGKTFVMISRLIRLIKEKKADVSEVLAMTFTESAAKDMKEKLKRDLVKEVEKTGDEYLVSQSKKVATADISTIHAFCSRLIRIYFHVAGVSHDFGIAEGLTAERLQNEAIDKTFRYFYSKGDETFKKVASYHAKKRSDREFRKEIISLYFFFSNEEDPYALMEKCSNMYTKEGLEKFASELIGYLKAEALPFEGQLSDLLDVARGFNKPKLYAFIDDVLKVASACQNLKTYRDLYMLKDVKVPLKTENKLDDVEQDVKDQASKIRDKLFKVISGYTSFTYDEDTTESIRLNIKEHVDCLISTVKKFIEFYSALKREENLLDFDDLQHFALKVLSNEEVLKTVKDKYKYIFVDEYQDVNAVQERIINLISRDNVFMVGDVKQSIYGFRGCRSDFFIDKFEKMSKIKGQTALLNHSFRSANAVIDAVNDVFCYSMTEKSFGMDYKKTSKLVAGGIYKDGMDGRSELHFLKVPDDKIEEKEEPRIYNILDELKSAKNQVSKLSSLLAKIIMDETSKKFYDTKQEKERFISFKDIAILARHKEDEKVMGVISGLKSHGIPIITETNEDISSYPEIRMMISLLKLIDCFYDDVALATVLKSPVGNFTDEELLSITNFYVDDTGEKYFNFSDSFNYSLEKENSPLHKKVKEFDDYITTVRDLADFLPIGEVLTKIVKDKVIEAFLYAQTDGNGKVKRLRRFLSYALSGGKPYTAKDVLRLIEESKDGLPFLPVDDADAVSIMTIHGSKGLEFPVVIVIGMEGTFGQKHESDEYLTDFNDGVAINLYDVDRKKKNTLWRKVFQKRMRVSATREEMRILYVALTRATYSLHMVCEHKDELRLDSLDTPLRYMECVPLSFPQTVHEYDEFDFEEISRGVRNVNVGKVDQKLKERMENNFSFRYPFMEDTSLPLKTSVTSAIAGDEPVYLVFDEYDDQTSKEKGIIAHKFMENAPLDASDVHLVANNLVEQGVMTKDELDKIDLDRLSNAFKSGVFNMSENAKVYREKSFLVNAKANMVLDVNTETEVLMQGVIDLLFLDGDKAKIVDYKYSRLNAESLKKKYRKQLDLYAFAVQKILGVKKVEKAIVSLLSGEVIKID